MTGTLHLLPVALGEAAPEVWLPPAALRCAAGLGTYIAENAKTARAFLKQIGTERPIQEITIHTLQAKTTEQDILSWLQPLKSGIDIGLVSEAGCPAVADPGARVVAQAHRLALPVKPWVGPSSILLALMGSGLDGQRFAFHGYAPVKIDTRRDQLQRWEAYSAKHQQTQILIETPYRNRSLWESLLETLRPDTQLCVARALTTPHEWLATRTVQQWRQRPPPELERLPTIFLYLATDVPGRRPRHP